MPVSTGTERVIVSSTSRKSARGWRAIIGVLAGSLLLLTGIPNSARAAETEWAEIGNGARTLSAVYSVTISGATYDVTRGADNNVWFRYNGGSWRPLGGDNATRTTSPPRIVEFPPGRAMTLVRGLDGEIWYSQVNSGSANFWAPWTRLPAGAGAIGSPMVSVLGSGLFIEAPNQSRLISTTWLESRGGVLTPSSRGWRVDNHALLSTDYADIEGTSQIAVYGTQQYEAVLRSFVVGTDNRVWSVTRTANSDSSNVTQVDSGAICESGVAAGRLGNQTTVVGPGQQGYAEQQRVLIACIGADGYVWNSTSNDGGVHFGNFSRPAGTPVPSTTAPAVNPTGTSWILNAVFNGLRSAQFPDKSVVGKRIS
ncbi:hypothetical protein AB0O64_25965 [Streptomyces sp. NPDC088341]|uniref:hypothetical protein n=1 Tax=Streptomyces sp. NPDC088341 TaxID=3154870 RepID=UPI0034307E94